MRKLSIWLGLGLSIAAFTVNLSGQPKRTLPQKLSPRGQGSLIVQSIDLVLPTGTDWGRKPGRR
jgi:hypothetical protein